jgi:hypothetical protein
MQSSTLETKQNMPKCHWVHAVFPNTHTHSNASLSTGDNERLLTLLKISMLHRMLVYKNTQRKKLKIVVFWDLTHSSLVTVCRRFGETWYPHLL